MRKALKWFGLVLAFIVSVACAETINATWNAGANWNCGPAGSGSDPTAICNNSSRAAYYGGAGTVYYGVSTQDATHKTCLYRNTFNTILNGDICTGSGGYTCPSTGGWTLSGSSCTRPDCPAGQTRNANGTCDCSSRAGQTAALSWCQVDSPTATSCTFSNSGCQIKCRDVTFQGSGTVLLFPQTAFGQNCRFTGAAASQLDFVGGPLSNEELTDIKNRLGQTSTSPESAKATCNAQGMGYVSGSNGVTCLGTLGGSPSGSSDPTNVVPGIRGSESSKTESTPNSADPTKTDTVKTEQKTTDTLTGDGGVQRDVTTIKTTTNGQTGQTTTTTTTKSETQGLSGFCEQNPTAAVCKGQSDPCKDSPDRAGCKDLGGVSESDGSPLPSKSIGPSSISPVVVPGNASCPADIPLPHGMTFSFERYCWFAQSVKPLVLLFAWLTAGFIVFGFGGKGGV